MDEIRPYSGLAGEIVRHFIRLKTFIVLIPMALVWLGLSLIAYFSKGYGYDNALHYFQLIVSLFFLAAFTGRFALAACRGDYHCGFFSRQLPGDEVLGYIIRFLIYNAVWMIPALLMTYYLLQPKNMMELFFLFRFGISLGNSVGIWYACLVVLAFFGPLTAALLAAYTDSLSEVMSLEPWQWLLNDRADDLPTYLAQLVGGMAVFFMKYLIPLFILKVLAFKLSLKLGIYFNEALEILPLLIFPVLLGRLSGAFVAMDWEHIELGTSDQNKAQNQRANNFLPEQKKIYENLVQTIEDLPQAELELAEKRAQSVEPNIYQALVLSYLFKKTKESQVALMQTRQTLSQCLQEGLGFEAVKLFHYYLKERTALNLPAEQLVQLAHYLTQQDAYADAAWCYMMAILQSPEEEKLAIEKHFLHVADTAQRRGAQNVANNLFSLFCQQFPDSSLAEFARQQIKEDKS